jgi:hypothetical protein
MVLAGGLLVVVIALVFLLGQRRLWQGVPAAAPTIAAASTDYGARLDTFWVWWSSAGARIAASLDAKDAESFVEELSKQVHAIDPSLAWETGPGLHGARHHLTLSSEGDTALRVTVQRWLARAPAPDAAWEYYPARQPYPHPESWALRLKDAESAQLDFAHLTAEIREDPARERVHLRLHHPTFSKLSEGQQGRAAFLALDSLLGEDDVERWIGRVDTSSVALAKGAPVTALTAAVQALAKSATGERFSLLQGKTAAGEPMVATVNLAIKRVDHLLMDYHLVLSLPLLDPTPEGLTTGEEAAALNALEDELIEVLGHDAVYLGRETGQRKRVMHFHAAGQGPSETRAKDWAKRHSDRRPTVTFQVDPTWKVLSKW